MTKISLDAEDIKRFDEIGLEKAAVDHALEVALNFHFNRHQEVHRHHRKIWAYMAERYGLDQSKQYQTTTAPDGGVFIIECKKEEGEDNED